MAELAGFDARLTPVIKGNGYGFTREVLAKESARLNVQRICVGTIYEVNSVAPFFAGEIQVLEPVNVHDPLASQQWREVLQQHGDRIIATVASTDVEFIAELGARYVVIELLTSMHRFGLKPQGVAHVVSRMPAGVQLRGFNLHLPIANPSVDDFAFNSPNGVKNQATKVQEIVGWISWLRDIAIGNDSPIALSISHTDFADIQTIKNLAPNVSLDVRLGTSLWLGAGGALKVTGTVLAVHDLEPGRKVGYTQSVGGKKLVIVSGGTSHGVALSAPTTTTSLRRRGIAIVEGFAQAIGRVRSPFIYQGSNLYFAEPPHMHVSMLWCEEPGIAVGDELLCTVRNTTAHFDVVKGLD